MDAKRSIKLTELMAAVCEGYSAGEIVSASCVMLAGAIKDMGLTVDSENEYLRILVNDIKDCILEIKKPDYDEGGIPVTEDRRNEALAKVEKLLHKTDTRKRITDKKTSEILIEMCNSIEHLQGAFVLTQLESVEPAKEAFGRSLSCLERVREILKKLEI